MNRREFLQSLAAMGAALIIPKEALAAATPAEIEQVWQAAVAEPELFWVRACGAIATSPGWDYPYCRGELFGIDIQLAEVTREELLQLYKEDGHIQSQLEWQYECAVDEEFIDEDAIPDIETWIAKSDEDDFDQITYDLKKWLYDDGLDPEDYEYCDLHGRSNRGEALSFFEQERDIAELFGIELVYGDHPGSSYYAAELRMDLDEANALAEDKGLPFRFAFDDAD